MNTNYTPIDVKKLERKGNGLNTILLSIVTFTALVLAIMLFVLIQKKISQNSLLNTPTPTPIKVVPTEVLPTEELVTPTATTSPTIIETTLTPEASNTSNLKE